MLDIKLISKPLTLKSYEGYIYFISKAHTIEENPDISVLWERTKASDFVITEWTIPTDTSFMDVSFIVMENADAQFDITQYLDKMALAIRHMKKKKIKHILVEAEKLMAMTPIPFATARQLSETAYLVGIEGFVLKKEKEEKTLETIQFVAGNLSEQLFDEGILLAKATQEARMLVNRPANDLTPEALAQRVLTLGEQHGFDVNIMDQSKIEQLKMHAFLSVAKGSSEQPKFIVMSYKGNPDSPKKFGLVGKGITYDSGGYSIKPTSSMVNMKNDMGGAAAVIGALVAIADAKLKANVVGVIAACENLISGDAYKPGDIVSSMSGKTIYIGNTDAEGRLTLADALYYIVNNQKVDMVVDIATLTGSARHCLGEEMTPVVANDDVLYQLAERAFSKSNEPLWRMPLIKAYREKVKHTEADLTNSAGHPGMITAGAFLESFIGDTPWVHIDIGATAYLGKATGVSPKGATGIGVRGLYQIAKKYAD